VAADLGIREIGPALFETVADVRRPAAVRVETLRALATLKDERLDKAVALALKDREPLLRTEGRRVLAKLRPAEALASLARALDEGGTAERQGSFAVLGEMKGGAADKLVLRWLDKLLAGEVPAEVRLDLLEAAARHPTREVQAKLARYESARPKGGPLGKWRDALVGGDAEAGRRIFLHKAEASCLRCHKANGEGTGEVGPDLTGIGSRHKRDYLLESIVEPNKQIAKGFETLDLTLSNGKLVSGILKKEDARALHLMTAEGKLVVVPKDKVEERRAGKSAMPEDLAGKLTRREVRDLVEFLASLREAPKR
jgi:quinoprotein glucose dehydrogenase